MWYVIYCTDGPDSLEKRKSVRESHLARVRELLDAGRLLAAGPRPAIDSPDPGPAGFSGSLIVARFDSLASARAGAGDDPYVAAGVWETIEVSPFLRLMPA